MSHRDSLNISILLNPIYPETPVGNDLRENINNDNLYYDLKEKRSKIRAKEREFSEEVHENSEMIKDWREIYDITLNLLETQTKDLEIATWFIEASVRLKGFRGLGDGFSLFRELIENFWPNIYPVVTDEDDIADKFNTFSGLNGNNSNGTLISPIYCIPLTAKNTTAVSTWDYQQATPSSLQQAALESGSAFAQALIDDIHYAMTAYQKLGELLDKKCGLINSPPSSKIQETLTFCLDAAQKIYQNILPSAIDSQTANNQHSLIATSVQQPFVYTTREESFQTLEKIAKYFRQSEPHSPVSYLIERAIAWGKLSLPELLSMIINDSQSLDYSYQLLGVQKNISETPVESEK